MSILHEGPEEGVPIPFPTWNFGKIPVPVGFLLEIPGRVIEIPVNKKPFIYRQNKQLVLRPFKPPCVQVADTLWIGGEARAKGTENF
jgi:hypothetical protein